MADTCLHFHGLSVCLVQSARAVGDEELTTELMDFLASYGGSEQRLPRSNRELLQAQILARRILLATREYGLVYEWYPSFKNPFGIDLAKAIPAHVNHVRSAARGYRWVSGYESVLECGCGTEALGLELARHNRRWIASDVVTPEALNHLIDFFRPGPAFEFAPMDAITISRLPVESVDVVLSRSFFEHLLPDDALKHLRSGYRVLKPGGNISIACPAGVGPPSDITNRFPEYATPKGLHIREYRVNDLAEMLKSVGFRDIRSRFVRSRLIGGLPVNAQRGNTLPIPLAARLESVAARTWRAWSRGLIGRKLWGLVWGHVGASSISVIARKPQASRGRSARKNHDEHWL